MNSTAEKLREAAAYMNDGMVGSASAITVLRDMFDVKNANTFGEDLGLVLDIIADELDELQARAAGANNMRQRLESAEKKAERRKKQVEHTEDAIRERNARLKMRGETIARLTAENGKLCKQVPSERERHILDIWPRFEDGEPVMIGDEATNNKNQRFTVKRIEFRHGKWMLNDSVTDGHYLNGKTLTFVNVTALHNGDDALVFETPIQSAPNVGASMTMTVELDEDE